MNIYEKISAVMQDVQYLAKDDHVKFNTTNYKAISEEKVTSVVRESLIKRGIVIVPIAQTHRREGTLSTVDVTYRVQNIEDSEDYIIVASSGTGADTQDKGVGKAMTYAYKYMLLRTFAIPTGEDPDKISSAELDDKEKATARETPKMATPEDMAELKIIARDQRVKLTDRLTSLKNNGEITGILYDDEDGKKVLSKVDVLIVKSSILGLSGGNNELTDKVG